MFTPDQANSAAPPQDNNPKTPTTIEYVSSLIHKVLCTVLDHKSVEDTFTIAFAAEAEIDPPQTLSKLYAALTSPNLISMKDHYDSTTYVPVSDTVANLCTIE